MAVLCLFTLAKLDDIGSIYRILAILSVTLWLPVSSLMRCYHKQHGYSTGLARLLGAWAILFGILVLVAFITKTSQSYSREIVLLWMVVGYLVQALAYVALHALQRRLYGSIREDRRSLIVGTGDQALALARTLQQLKRDPVMGLVAQRDDVSLPDNREFRILGNLAHLRDLISEHQISRLYIALPLSEAEDIRHLYIDLLDASVDVVWVPDMSSMTLLNHSIGHIGPHVALYLNESPLTAYPASALIKASLDRVLALLAIIVLSPLMLITAVLIKIGSPGPVLFKQPRHGMNGKVFNVYKFRSMQLHQDQQVRQATRDDQRITPIGRFIRRTSIDELPQFFNVLKGDMSLVGPRPHAVAHNSYYADKIEAYMARHRIKPGITGLAQISGYRGETETLDKMRKRVEIDLEYINHWSLWLDVKIVIKTPFTLFGKNIY